MLSLKQSTLRDYFWSPVIGTLAVADPDRQQTLRPLSELRVPWSSLQHGGGPSELVSWHTRTSHFVGRDNEMKELEHWAFSGLRTSVKFVTGPGGVGKTRLAAEFADSLRTRGWTAGFVSLRRSVAFPLRRRGALLIVDYAEETLEEIGELLADLAVLESPARLRVLILSRSALGDWQEIVDDSRASQLVESTSLELGPLSRSDAYNLFVSAQGEAAVFMGTAPLPVTEDAFAAWLDLAPQHNRAAFVVALAAYSASHPSDPQVTWTGPELIDALVKREVGRLRRLARETSIEDRHALGRLVATATIAGGISAQQLPGLVEAGLLGTGVTNTVRVTEELRKSGVIDDSDMVNAFQPEIIGAAFVSRVLAIEPDAAPDTVWLALATDPEAGLARLGRLAYDAEFTLGVREQGLGHWLAIALKGHPDRCQTLRPFLSDVQLPTTLVEPAIAMWRTLLMVSSSDKERAALLNNLSVHLGEEGDLAGAQEAVRDMVTLYRSLAEANPARYEPDLAMSLNRLSFHLRDVGDRVGGLGAIQEAVDLYRRLAEANPARYESDLATSLTNLSNRLSGVGDREGGLSAIREAVDLYRRLAEANPARYEANLAGSLHNLSRPLSELGDRVGALEAIRTAVEIRRRLAEANPARYELDLATSLISLSATLSEFGDREDALEAIREAVEIRRRLAEASPARYEPDLAMSLNNLSIHLSEVGDREGGLGAIQEAVDLYRRLARAYPARYESDLATSLTNLSIRLGEVGDREGGLSAIREAVDLYRRLAEANPARYEANLAGSLHNLSRPLSELGDRVGALEVIRTAVEIRRRLADADPARYELDLATSLGTCGSILVALGRHRDAADSFREGAELVRPYAQADPASRLTSLLEALESDHHRASGAAGV